MKVVVASQGDSLDSQMDPRFGRCAYFVLVDTDTMEFEAIENTAAQQSSGAGSAAAQMVGETDAEAVVAANYGPNSTQVLQAGGIAMLQAAGMTVEQAAQAAANGQLAPVSQATVADKAGMKTGGGNTDQSGGQPGGGMGMGGGMGQGRGMGRGMGGCGSAASAQAPGASGGEADASMGAGWRGAPGMGMGRGMGMGMAPGMGWDEGCPQMGQPGPWGPMAGYQPDPEQMRQYQLTMLRAQAQMLEQELDFVRNQIEYLEGEGV